jgi:hypothetical protein
MLSAYKGESNRDVRAADSGNDGAPREPIQQSGKAGAMAKDQTLYFLPENKGNLYKGMEPVLRGCPMSDPS